MVGNWFRKSARIVSVEYVLNLIIFFDGFHNMGAFLKDGRCCQKVRFGHFQGLVFLWILEQNCLVMGHENIGSFLGLLGLLVTWLFDLNWFKFWFSLDCFEAFEGIFWFEFMSLMGS